MLEVDNLSFTYPNGRATLSGITLAVEGGESVAIMGENGAGKTTLVRHFNGLLLPTSGRVLVDGLDTRAARGNDLAHKVGLVFQNPYQQLFAQTVAQEIALGIRSDEGAVVQEMLETFHLQGLENRHPLSLSEGERKRLALASVLAAHPSLLVLDEPTLGQDGRAKAALEAVIESLRAQGRAVIVVTHDVDFACACCQRIVLVSRGRVVADGPVEEVVGRGELLRKVGLVPPQLVDLSRRLGSMGFRELSAPTFSGGGIGACSPLGEAPSHVVLLAPFPGGHGPLRRKDPRGKIVTASLIFVSLIFARHAHRSDSHCRGPPWGGDIRTPSQAMDSDRHCAPARRRPGWCHGPGIFRT